ncbi:YbhB/YbcL family Raf kinase inhibitor-like protein [Candidatus Parcubacteria bacterium]|nr:YbhB/YbcL family Raf kinase inhibitor-like protein [Candidatus Parcubacteria bacterium]
MCMQIVSPDFATGTLIPSRFTCEGENINPELHIAGVPHEAKCLALIVDDPDAPQGTFTHWVVWGIPTLTTRIMCGTLPIEAVEGCNSADKAEYSGPCPPSGTHRYIFTLYALDEAPELPPGATKEKLLGAITGHIIGQAELVGLYCKDENR